LIEDGIRRAIKEEWLDKEGVRKVQRPEPKPQVTKTAPASGERILGPPLRCPTSGLGGGVAGERVSNLL